MHDLNIEATKFCPKVCFSANEKIFEIIGFSLPENVADMYMPVIEWLNVFEEQAKVNNALREGPYKMIFKLSYFNSASLRFIVDIIKKINTIYQIGVNICIEWYYDDGDTQIKESGNELGELVTIPFHVIEAE
ncbi:MAG: DUF1987 domain-containing protein [Bacteroidales bacterium]|nr:DUF1987 domain-containing protein [Bacteroidales bacterium]